MVSAHSDGVHDKLAPMVIVWGTGLDIVGIVFGPKVVAEFMGGHQVSFLVNRHIRIANDVYIFIACGRCQKADMRINVSKVKLDRGNMVYVETLAVLTVRTAE